MATILVVDDNASSRKYLAALIGCLGHNAVEADSGATGLALARTLRPHLVITDLVMPVMDGYEFLRQLRSDPHIAATPALLYTGSDRDGDLERRAASCGVSAVLLKPSRAPEIMSAIRRALPVRRAAGHGTA